MHDFRPPPSFFQGHRLRLCFNGVDAPGCKLHVLTVFWSIRSCFCNKLCGENLKRRILKCHMHIDCFYKQIRVSMYFNSIFPRVCENRFRTIVLHWCHTEASQGWEGKKKGGRPLNGSKSVFANSRKNRLEIHKNSNLRVKTFFVHATFRNSPFRYSPHSLLHKNDLTVRKRSPPRPKCCGGDDRNSPSYEFCNVAVVHSQRYSENYECVIMKVNKRCADFSLKMHLKRLAAGLRPDPLGELTALSQAP